MAQFSMEIMRLTGSVPRGNQHAKGRFNAEVSSLREPGGDYPHILSRYHYYNNNGVWASGIGSARVPVGTYTGVRIIANTGNIQLTDFLIEGIKL